MIYLFMYLLILLVSVIIVHSWQIPHVPLIGEGVTDLSLSPRQKHRESPLIIWGSFPIPYCETKFVLGMYSMVQRFKFVV